MASPVLDGTKYFSDRIVFDKGFLYIFYVQDLYTVTFRINVICWIFLEGLGQFWKILFLTFDDCHTIF